MTSRAPKTELFLKKLKTSIVLTLQCLLELLDGQDNEIEIEAKAAFTVREVTSKNSYFPLCWSVQFYLPHVSEIHFALSIENLQRRFQYIVIWFAKGKPSLREQRHPQKKGVCLGTFTSKTLFPDGFLCFPIFNLLINIECIQCFPNENKSQEFQFCWLGQ